MKNEDALKNISKSADGSTCDYLFIKKSHGTEPSVASETLTCLDIFSSNFITTS